jgi:hypothetical protein
MLVLQLLQQHLLDTALVVTVRFLHIIHMIDTGPESMLSTP